MKTEWKVFGVVLVISIVIAVVLFGFASLMKQETQQVSLPTPVAQTGETVSQGMVIENTSSPYSDGPRYFTLQTAEKKEIRVVYHYGEFPRCLNNEAALKGGLLEKGEAVKVLGKVVGDNEISTCDSLDYYIEKVEKTKEQVDTSDWQTYRNEEFGFEVRYPKAFEEIEQCALREGIKPSDSERLLHLGNSIDINIKDAQGLDFAEFAVEEFGTIKHGTYEDVLLGIDLQVKESFVVDNEKAVRVASRSCGTCRYGEMTHILHSGRLYQLSYFARPSCVKLDFEQFEYGELDVLHEILSTFRFIE